jgi:hypothetical protein
MVLSNEQFREMYGAGGRVAENSVSKLKVFSPGLKDKKYRWPNKNVFYEFTNVLDSVKTSVRQTLEKLSRKVDGCIKFQDRSDGRRVRIENGPICASTLGYQYNMRMVLNVLARTLNMNFCTLWVLVIHRADLTEINMYQSVGKISKTIYK